MLAVEGIYEFNWIFVLRNSKWASIKHKVFQEHLFDEAGGDSVFQRLQELSLSLLRLLLQQHVWDKRVEREDNSEIDAHVVVSQFEWKVILDEEMLVGGVDAD